MKVFGHRGASAHARENTLAAFRRAFDDGADGVELDVRLCRSGELVVLHDAKLDRVWGDPRPVWRLDLAEIRCAAPELPTLDQVWEDVGARGALHIEVKSNVLPFRSVPRTDAGAPWRPTAEGVRRWLRRHGLASGRSSLALSSFDPRVLAWLAVGVPRVPRALLFETTQGYPIPPLLLARLLACRAVHPEWPLCDAALVARARRAGLSVNAWTVDEPEALARMAAVGVDGVFSDDPGLARKAVGGG